MASRQEEAAATEGAAGTNDILDDSMQIYMADEQPKNRTGIFMVMSGEKTNQTDRIKFKIDIMRQEMHFLDLHSKQYVKKIKKREEQADGMKKSVRQARLAQPKVSEQDELQTTLKVLQEEFNAGVTIAEDAHGRLENAEEWLERNTREMKNLRKSNDELSSALEDVSKRLDHHRNSVVTRKDFIDSIKKRCASVKNDTTVTEELTRVLATNEDESKEWDYRKAAFIPLLMDINALEERVKNQDIELRTASSFNEAYLETLEELATEQLELTRRCHDTEQIVGGAPRRTRK